MLNHARTLLLNLPGSAELPDFPGEEIIPPDFRPLTLPSDLAAVRACLFGGAPDRYFLNYRAHQYLTVLHGSFLADYVHALDPRITYDLTEVTSLAWPLLSYALADGPGEALLGGTALADEALGISFRAWRVTLLGGGVAEISRSTPPPQPAVNLPYTVWEDGLISPLSLPGSDLFLRCRDGAGAVWNVTTLAKPFPGFAGQLRLLESLLGPDGGALFGPAGEEPWSSFRNLWQTGDPVPHRLGAALLGLIYRCEGLRTK